MRDEKYEWTKFTESLVADGHPRMVALAPLSALLGADPDMSALYPYTSLCFFGLSTKPWESEPHGFDRCFPGGLCALGEEDGKTISLRLFLPPHIPREFTLASGEPEYIFGILKALYKKGDCNASNGAV